MAKLFWLQPDDTIIEFPLKAEQNLIGRSSRCDVRIKHPGVSAEHALIRVLPGVATVEDMGSTNGTRVNGRRIESHTLRHGVQIGVGRERLMYFAELDDAAKALQPEAIEPFAQPAPGGETVDTSAPAASAPPPPAADALLDLPLPPRGATLAPASADVAAPAAARHSAAVGMPDLDPALLASLPRGTTLTGGAARAPAVAASGARATQPRSGATSAAPAATPAPAKRPPAPQPARSLTASVTVLTGPATGQRYPLDQATVTLGKEGKQVIEFQRVSPSRWQIQQREGVTPAYINGDTLVAARELAAGDVIELIGVTLRFEVSLAG